MCDELQMRTRITFKGSAVLAFLALSSCTRESQILLLSLKGMIKNDCPLLSIAKNYEFFKV